MSVIQSKAGLLRDFCKAALVLSEEGLLEMDKGQLECCLVDPSHMCMSQIILPINNSEVKVDQPEARTIDFKKLLSALKFSAFEETVRVDMDGKRIIIKAGKFTHRFTAPDQVLWPKIPTLNVNTKVKMPVAEIKKFFKICEHPLSVRIELRPDAMSFKNGDTVNETELEIPRAMLSDINEGDKVPSRSSYDKDKLQAIIALATDELSLTWDRDLPVIIRPIINSDRLNVQATFYLAPQIDDLPDEESGEEEEVASDD
jgi:hypothetical protein